MSDQGLLTAGQSVRVVPPALRGVVEEAAGERLGDLTGPAGLALDNLLPPPPEATSQVVTRGVCAGPAGVLIRSVGGSGFTQLWSLDQAQGDDAAARVRVSSRWSPSAAEAAAARLLPQRSRALRAQVLLHYPALWTALVTSGMSPLHVSVVEVEGLSVLLAGPGGVGKSSLVADALAHGARAVCDNLAVSDGRTVHGVVEPLRLPAELGEGGRRAAHGRREHRWPGRLSSLRPDLVVVVRRDDHGTTDLRPLPRRRAAQQLVAGTYAAGELQRFWPLVAQLALAGLGPTQPPVQRTASRLTAHLPCYELTLGRPTARTEATRGRLAHLLTGITGARRPAAPPALPRLLNGSPS